MRQFKFGFMNDLKNYFGGSLLKGKRKTLRPLSTKKPIHLIMKTSGRRFFGPGNASLENLIHRQASRYGVNVHRVSLNWSHIHMIIQIPTREAYKAFIRTLAAAMVRALTQYKKINLKGIFDLRPFTRILEWGRDFAKVMSYHDLNDLEARGFIRRKKKPSRKTRRGKTASKTE